MTEPLKREIGFFSAVLLVIGGIVGSGIFKNPAVVAHNLHAPPLILAAWAIGGGVALLGALVYAEMAARMPETGGEYAYLKAAFHPLVAFLFGWTTLLVVQTGGMAAVALIFAENVQKLTGTTLPGGLIAVVTLALLAAANCAGVRAGNGVQSGLGALKLMAIGGIVLAGLFLVPKPYSLTQPMTDAVPAGGMLKNFGAAIIPVLFAFGGWQTSNMVAGEMKDPRRDLARALIIGVIGVIVLYLAVTVACLRALGPDKLALTATPAADALEVALGPVGASLTAAAIALSTLGFLSQSMLTAPRVYFAMARDGLFFKSVGAVASGSRAPVLAILIQAGWAAVLVLSGTYDRLLSYVVAMNFLFFGLTGAAIFVLRRREAAGAASEPGFRAPWHPITTGLFVLACAVVVASSFWAYPIDSTLGYGLMLLGVPAYLLWRRFGTVSAA